MKILSLIYGFIVFVRNKLYDWNILKSKKVDGVGVICIGNIVVGGSGKTPAVQYFCKKYLAEGKKVGILSRGYKGKRENDLLLVRDESGILASALESGDEAFLHSLSLPVPVVVCSNRYEGAKYLKEKCGVEVVIMDDGFQHRKLLKDKNIVLIDATNPFGGDNYLPKGRLRESVNELKRADEIIITKSNYVNPENIEKIKSRIKKYGKKIFVATFEGDYFYDNLDRKYSLDEIKDKKILIFSSIANPNVFYNTIEKLRPASIKQVTFDDHHSYTESEIENLSKEAKKYDYLLTTEKDIVKVNIKIPNLLVLKMKFDII